MIRILIISIIFLYSCEEAQVKENNNSDNNRISNEPVQAEKNNDSAQGNIDPSQSDEVNEVDEKIIEGISPRNSELSDKKSVSNDNDTEDQSNNTEEIVEVYEVNKELAPPVKEEKLKEEDAPGGLHDLFDKVLQEYVSASGKVNYAGLKSHPRKLTVYLKMLADNPVETSWSRNKKLAYWINAYNAFTIKRILDNYPLNSIMDLDNGKTWDVKWIKLGGKTYSLNQIEHEIIRPQFKDARIHFAVNCAAKSCPPLYNKAYTEENVNRYLEKRTIQFINDNKYNSISTKKAEISKIFEWYQEDFGDLITYLNKYLKQEDISKKAKVSFKEYDWSLNN